MKKAFIAALLTGILAIPIGATADTQSQSRWPYGFWVGVLDEDSKGGPFDFIEIRTTGTVVFWGFCRDGRATGGVDTATFHLYSGDIYVTSEVPGKGPITLVFPPNPAKTKLTYTSPRTRNNAYFEHREKSPCATS